MSDKTWIDLVREYLPNATDDEANSVLWNWTAFPFGDEAQIRQQVKDFAEGKAVRDE